MAGILWTLYGVAGVFAPDTMRLPYPQIHVQRELAETVLLAVLIFLSVRASFQNFRVEGASMVPSLENGEYLIVNKLSYAELDMGIFNFLPSTRPAPTHHAPLGQAQRGDIIVFRAPTSPTATSSSA
jgi:signal peptidase I